MTGQAVGLGRAPQRGVPFAPRVTLTWTTGWSVCQVPPWSGSAFPVCPLSSSHGPRPGSRDPQGGFSMCCSGSSSAQALAEAPAVSQLCPPGARDVPPDCAPLSPHFCWFSSGPVTCPPFSQEPWFPHAPEPPGLLTEVHRAGGDPNAISLPEGLSRPHPPSAPAAACSTSRMAHPWHPQASAQGPMERLSRSPLTPLC